MCDPNVLMLLRIALLNAEDRDALREFAFKRAGRAVTQDQRRFWEGIAAQCVHPKPVQGRLSFVPNGDPHYDENR